MKHNNRGTQDARRVLSGKDGALYDGDGNLMATVTQYTIAANISNATYNPLGSAQTYKHLLSYEATLTFTETVIESSSFIQSLYRVMESGVPETFVFQGVFQGWDGSEERVILRDCIPDGQINLQSANVGELWSREMTFAVNSPPELQKLLSYSEG